MHDLTLGAHEVLSLLKPDSWTGALLYFVLFIVVGALLSRALRAAVHAAMTRQGHVDRTTIGFVQQFGSVFIWATVLILYAHLIPVLRAMGTALLAGAGIASVVIGLAAQSTLGNLVAGVSIMIYRPFGLGDTLQVAAPTGTEIGVVERISLGYTTLRAPDGRLVILPNSVAASQVILNLTRTFAPWRMSITIRVGRDVDVEAARTAAVSVGTTVVGEHARVLLWRLHPARCLPCVTPASDRARGRTPGGSSDGHARATRRRVAVSRTVPCLGRRPGARPRRPHDMIIWRVWEPGTAVVARDNRKPGAAHGRRMASPVGYLVGTGSCTPPSSTRPDVTMPSVGGYIDARARPLSARGRGTVIIRVRFGAVAKW
jgi:small conductance mechanosensitive channel